ncbi:hypothetical protein [Streptomyces sp. NRRL F-5123]|uniref:hypothetical protein n=1 Tax=Streptomyces sp. NRRL F-5123 TaxID=1463856 RepID=UPI0004E14B08|nr:hypothetical protein [Streptomyces sp. NRRL F-5123]
MAREREGWEYVPGQGSRWAPTVEVQMANMLVGKYGDEYDEAKHELDDLVRAAYRDAAEELRGLEPEVPEGFTLRGEWLAGFEEARQNAVDLTFPEYPQEFEDE